MNEVLRFVLCAVFLTLGTAAIAVGILGVFRFRFVLNRMHCAALIDTLGALLIVVGLLFAADAPVYVWKLLAVVMLLWIGSPIASHLVARMELLTDPDAKKHMASEDEDGIL